MNSLSVVTAALALLVASAIRPESEERAAGQPFEVNSDTSVLKGRIVFDGKKPKPKRLEVNETQLTGCSHEEGAMDMNDRSLLVDKERGVANVVVEVKVPNARVDVPEKPFVVNNLRCRFEPHVRLVPVGSTVEFRNSDSAAHNVHTYSRKNPSINRTIAPGSKETYVLKRGEFVNVKCDIHPWMKGWIVATDTPFAALTDSTGAFSIEGLPPGQYEARLWHERLGKLKANFTVTPGEATEVEWKMQEKKARR